MGPSLPAPHAAFLEAVLPRLARDAPLSGVPAGLVSLLGGFTGERRPVGVGKLERVAPHLAARVARTVAACEAASCFAASREWLAVYRELRAESAPADLRVHASPDEAAVAFVDALAASRRESRPCWR